MRDYVCCLQGADSYASKLLGWVSAYVDHVMGAVSSCHHLLFEYFNLHLNIHAKFSYIFEVLYTLILIGV